MQDRTDHTVTLYHGTTPESHEALIRRGWCPNSWHGGGNCGQTRYLYLSTDPEDARWFSNEKGHDLVLQLDVPLEHLVVDPEDGAHDTLMEELNSLHGLPGKVALTQPLDAHHFREYAPEADQAFGLR